MKKILFVTIDEFSNINPSLQKQLLLHYPDHELQVLKLKPLLMKNYRVLFIGVIALLFEYFPDFIKGHKKITGLKKYFYFTPYVMRYFNNEIARHLKANQYSFVFQTQSIFDSSSEKVSNFVYTDHTILYNLHYPLIDANEYRFSKRYMKLEKAIYDNATQVFVMSANIKESLVSQYGVHEDKIKLVYVGSNTAISTTVNRQKYANKNILFVGKDWERKGGPLLFEAFKIVLQSIPDATLTVLGCSPDIRYRNCNVYGKVPLQEVAVCYNKASVFCLPTKREPFGVVFIEAMLNRLAIVTNTVGATPDLVINDKNGYRLNYDAKEYAATLITLLNNPDKCEELGANSYRYANQAYTWDHVGQLISKNINEALTKS